MTDVIEFFTFVNIQLWNVIVSNWILSISVLISVLGFVISLVNISRGSNK